MRLFVGFQLPNRLIEEVVNTQSFLQSRLKTQNIVRWIKKESLHITVVFLGEVEEGSVKAVKKIVEQMAEKYPKIQYSVLNFDLWPKGNSARILSIQLNHPSNFAKLQANLVNKLSRYAPKMGKLKPAHITIGRVKKHTKAGQMQKLTEAVNAVRFSIKNVTFKNLRLFQSILSPKGSVYKILPPP